MEKKVVPEHPRAGDWLPGEDERHKPAKSPQWMADQPQEAMRPGREDQVELRAYGSVLVFEPCQCRSGLAQLPGERSLTVVDHDEIGTNGPVSGD
jgi:hypothetical protein